PQALPIYPTSWGCKANPVQTSSRTGTVPVANVRKARPNARCTNPVRPRSGSRTPATRPVHGPNSTRGGTCCQAWMEQRDVDGAAREQIGQCRPGGSGAHEDGVRHGGGPTTSRRWQSPWLRYGALV